MNQQGLFSWHSYFEHTRDLNEKKFGNELLDCCFKVAPWQLQLSIPKENQMANEFPVKYGVVGLWQISVRQDSFLAVASYGKSVHSYSLILQCLKTIDSIDQIDPNRLNRPQPKSSIWLFRGENSGSRVNALLDP